MDGRHLVFLLVVALGPACNDGGDGDDGDTSLETCSTEHVTDDVDDGTDEATAAQPAPAGLSY